MGGLNWQRPDWFDAAACADVPTSVFFPEEDAPGDPRSELHDSHIARLICSVCPVADECLDYALANKERYGIFAGLSETQRRKVAAARRRRASRRRARSRTQDP